MVGLLRNQWSESSGICKLRYFKTLRVEMYARMREWLNHATPEALLYLWREAPGSVRRPSGSLLTGKAFPVYWTDESCPATKGDGLFGRYCLWLCGPDPGV